MIPQKLMMSGGSLMGGGAVRLSDLRAMYFQSGNLYCFANTTMETTGRKVFSSSSTLEQINSYFNPTINVDHVSLGGSSTMQALDVTLLQDCYIALCPYINIYEYGIANNGSVSGYRLLFNSLQSFSQSSTMTYAVINSICLSSGDKFSILGSYTNPKTIVFGPLS